MASPSTLLDIARRAGLIGLRRIPALTTAVARWGPTFAAPYAAGALATPNRAAIVDDGGAITFRELDRRSTELARGLLALGLERDDALGIACTNHREAVEAVIAAAKAALVPVLLNTSFAAPQMAEVLAREDVMGLVVDRGLLGVVDGGLDGPVVVVDADAEPSGESRESTIPHPPTSDQDLSDDGAHTIASVRRSGSSGRPLIGSTPRPPVLLTSGTTGTPKGARRNASVDTTTATAVVGAIPFRSDDVFCITSPVFHAWGFAQLGLAAAFGATVVMSARFDADATLRRIEQEGVSVLVVVPTILQRLLASPLVETTDLSSLRIVASSGSALPASLVEEWLDRVGPNLYNLYGSTEVGQATLAAPADLRHAPGTAGRALPGSVVRILDDDGVEVPTGTTGRIFVRNGAQFEGYTGGGGKEIVSGLMSSGDVGFLDDTGLLFVTGRSDDMIVSGGENVFPREIEDLLVARPEIEDVAVVGVDDAEFGQRLVAHVVTRPGATLTAERVRRIVGDQLARHKVPRDVVFVDELPRTATGKIRRSEL